MQNDRSLKFLLSHIFSPFTLVHLWLCLVLSPVLWAVHPSLDIPARPAEDQLLAPQLWPTFPVDAELDITSLLSSSSCQMRRVDQPTRLLVIGDTRAAINGIGPSARWFSQADLIQKKQPDVLLHLGDWVKNGRARYEWQATLRSLEHLNATPLLSVRGNHDRGGLFESHGFTDHPHTPLRVACVHGILVFLFDTEVSTWSARAAVELLLKKVQDQTAWSPTSLHKAGVKTKIWAQHRPIWSSGTHGSDERGWSDWLVPLLEKLDIDLHLSGHDHDYERFCASLGIGSQRRCSAQGINYIVSGGGASVTVPLPGLSSKVSALQKEVDSRLRQAFSSSPHILEVSLTEQQLHMQAWSTPREGSSSVFDHVNLPIR